MRFQICFLSPKLLENKMFINPDGTLFTSENESCSVMSDSVRPHGLYIPWNSPGRNTGVGSCSLLQGIFPTQGSNPGLLHCRWILYQLSHKMTQMVPLRASVPTKEELQSAVGCEHPQGAVSSPLPDRMPTTELSCPLVCDRRRPSGASQRYCCQSGNTVAFWKKLGVNINTLCEEA